MEIVLQDGTSSRVFAPGRALLSPPTRCPTVPPSTPRCTATGAASSAPEPLQTVVRARLTAPMSTRVQATSTATRVDLIGEAIVSGTLRRGTRRIPPEPVLCETLRVSRTVIREAIKSLVAKGLARDRPEGRHARAGLRRTLELVRPRRGAVARARPASRASSCATSRNLRRVVEPAAVRHRSRARHRRRTWPEDRVEAYEGMKAR